MFLMIDNYDSFVHNLARYFTLAGVQIHVARNDSLTMGQIADMAPEALILSPGPRAPAEAGICLEAIKTFGKQTPILGVCLGHQCIGQAYGGQVVRAKTPVHGKASPVHHDGQGVFAGLPSPFPAGRYHSLIVDLPDTTRLQVTARTAEGEIMGLQHPVHPVYGVQFHPESLLTEHGLDLVQNFVQIVAGWHLAQHQKSKVS